MKQQHGRRYLPLDNAAKIFPASMRPTWSNVFRIAVTFRERIDPAALQRAADRAAQRFPSVAVRLGRGLFWYYLEEGHEPPQVQEEGCQPLFPMRKKEMRRLAMRILYYENRMAVELFHALTDGSGALIFVKTLSALYLEETKGIKVPVSHGILDPAHAPSSEEMEDSFLRYAGAFAAKRDLPPAFHLTGVPEPDGFLHVTRCRTSSSAFLALAREKGVSITAYLAAALVYCIAEIQKKRVAPARERAVRVQIPVNLRKHFPSDTMRNFVAVFHVGLEKGELDADFDEILHRVHHQMGLANTPRTLRAIFTANVNSEKGMGIRLIPLFLKNMVMRAVFDRVGESQGCLCLSNLGPVTLPPSLAQEIESFDFIIGPQAKAPYNCGVISFGDTLCLHLVRNTVEPELERAFFSFLRERGVDFVLDSNER